LFSKKIDLAQRWIFNFFKGGVEKFILVCKWQNRCGKFLGLDSPPLYVRPCLSLSGVHSDDPFCLIRSGPVLITSPGLATLVPHQVICMRKSRLFELLFPLASVSYFPYEFVVSNYFIYCIYCMTSMVYLKHCNSCTCTKQYV
jgi:hypothetical protein